MNTLTLNVRRLLAHAVLGFVLLFAQQHAVQHWLSHAVEATHSKAKGTTGDNCLDCDAVAVFGSGFLPAAAPFLPALPDLGEALVASPATSQRPALLAAAYQPRAPPIRG